MRKLAVVLGLALAGVACVPSTTKTEITNVVQTNPDGAVGGLVFDYTGNNAPLAGVTVTLYTGRAPLMATTDAAGYYTFPTVPVGSFTVTFSIAGYGNAVYTGSLDSEDPNRPVTNPQTTLNPVGLVKTDQSFSLRVVDESGNAVAGAVLSTTVNILFVEWLAGDGSNNGAQPRARGSYVVTATTGADGTATFTGLPAFAKLFGVIDSGGQIQVHVAPILVTGSTIAYTFNGGDYSINVLDVDSSNLGSGDNGHDDLPTITLNSADNSLSIEKSSIEYLEKAPNGGFANIKGTVGATIAGPISIQFNNSLNTDPKTISVQVLELEEGLKYSGTPARLDRVKASAVTFTAAVNGNILTLTPGTAPVAGKTYWMTLSVQAAQKTGGAARTFSTTFPFWGPLNADVAVTGAKQLDRSCVPTDTHDTRPEDVVTFLLNEPIGVGTDGVGLASEGRITFHCASYFTAAEFNGSSAVLGTGEIDGAGAVICDQGGPEGRGDITLIFPEAKPVGAQDTGFGAKFELVVSTGSFYACDPSIAVSCAAASNQFTRPGAGMHKITFRFQSGAQVVRRLNGTPVSDFTIELPTTPSNNDPVPTSCTT